MTRARKTAPVEKSHYRDFGAPDEFNAQVFRVEIPEAKTGAVRIVESFGYRGGEGGAAQEEERVILPRAAWSGIADAARKDFNERLKAHKLATGRWKTGRTVVDRLLGKELCVLAWAAERATPEELPVICSRWAALRPEERWWLFSMTVAEAGLAEDSERGWRRALYCALSDGESRPPSRKRNRPPDEICQISLFDITP
jgi:hypothetical protein